MKYEYGTFLPTGINDTFVLNDWSLNVNRLYFWVDGLNKFHGYDDGASRVAQYGSSNSISTTRSIVVHNGTSTLLTGRVTRLDVGEFDITWDMLHGTVISFLAIED